MSQKQVCRRKRRYKDELTARIAASHLNRRFTEFRWYRCPVCHGFHLTTQLRRDAKKPPKDLF